MFLFCLVFAMSLCTSVYMCIVVTCWERADLLALVCGVFCEFVTFPLVSWVRCGTWLYRFLIFAPLLTFRKSVLRFSLNFLDILKQQKENGRKYYWRIPVVSWPNCFGMQFLSETWTIELHEMNEKCFWLFSRYRGLVFGMWLWYFLIILTYF